MTPAVEINNWSVAYPGGEAVLKNCSLALHYGEFAVLSGLSGEGKSTLLSSIAGVIPHAVQADTQGEIPIDGLSVAAMQMTDIARRVGTVLQNPDSQIFHSRVDDEIAFGCENLALPREEIACRIQNSCDLVGLNPDAPTRTLSGGQKQRLMTACVFAMGQKILLLDEPLANLDLAGSLQLLGILANLCREGYAVLMVEHRLDIVLPYAHRVFALEDGEVIETDRESAGFAGGQKISDTIAFPRPGGLLLSAQNLAYTVDETAILQDVSLDVRRGERIVILGENGCGKTTLLRMIAGLIKPSSGKITADISAKPGSRRWFRSVGYVYQEPSYQLFMPTVQQELNQGASDSWGARCLADFSLAPLADRHPQSLSEGQKRRVGIAAVMATAPGLILLDEPTVGQDFDHLSRTVGALNQMHAETGNAMITITHDYRCAEALADRVVWLKEGRVFAEGGRELVDAYFSSAVPANTLYSLSRNRAICRAGQSRLS